MMTEKIQYPILSGLNSMHLTPDGAWLTTREQVRIDNTIMTSDSAFDRLIAYYPALPVNESARDFLLLCDGTKNYEEILAELAAKYNVDVEEARACISPFYTATLEKGHIKLLDKPEKNNIKTSGSVDMFYPVHMQFELTDECNMFCNYCYRNAKYVNDAPFTREAVSSRSFKEVETMLENCIANGVRTIELSGGEPMMSVHFKDIIKLLAKHGILVAIESNGTFIDDEMADLIANCGNIMLSISLDAPNEEINSKISHCPGAFQRTVDGLKRLTARKVAYRVAATACWENIDHMEELLLLAKELGAIQFGCALPMSFGRQKNVEKRNGEAVESLGCRFNKKWSELTEKYPSFVARFDDSTWNYHKQVGNCGVGHRSFGVDPDGNVRVCTVNTAIWSQIGNFYKDKYEDIFGNPLVKFFRNLQAPVYDICGECPQLLVSCGNCVMRGIETYLDRKEKGEVCQWGQAFGIDEALKGLDLSPSSHGVCAKVEAFR